MSRVGRKIIRVALGITYVNDPGGGGTLDISLGGEVRRGPSYSDPV